MLLYSFQKLFPISNPYNFLPAIGRQLLAQGKVTQFPHCYRLEEAMGGRGPKMGERRKGTSKAGVCKVFCIGHVSDFFLKLYVLCCNYVAFLLQHEGNHRQHLIQWAHLVIIQLIYKTDNRMDLAFWKWFAKLPSKL